MGFSFFISSRCDWTYCLSPPNFLVSLDFAASYAAEEYPKPLTVSSVSPAIHDSTRSISNCGSKVVMSTQVEKAA